MSNAFLFQITKTQKLVTIRKKLTMMLLRSTLVFTILTKVKL